MLMVPGFEREELEKKEFGFTPGTLIRRNVHPSNIELTLRTPASYAPWKAEVRVFDEDEPNEDRGWRGNIYLGDSLMSAEEARARCGEISNKIKDGDYTAELYDDGLVEIELDD